LGILDHELLFTGAIEPHDDLQIVPAATPFPDHPYTENGVPDTGSGMQAVNKGLIFLMFMLMFMKGSGRCAPGFPRILNLENFGWDFIQEP
jgi:hypothetical protein